MVRIASVCAVAGCCLLAIPVAAVHQASSSAPAARAEIKNREGQTIGRAELVNGPHGVILSLRLDAAAPTGEHALHIHTTGTCQAPTFESAGGHFNPTSAAHGVLSEKGPHVGDLPNIHIPSGGFEAELFVDGASVAGASGKNALLDSDGAAIVLHAKPDDYRSDPAGAAGDRVACGVITKAS